ncbi:MAG: TRIC cation channel family protein, partial [Clostridia bacterium]|nr:TRIC cation channel family protein [Clostridia bacterium]
MYNILELFGIAAFAVSGAFVGVKKRLDILGILVLAIVTACGGGLIRDIVLNKTVPVFFYTPEYLLTTIIVTVVVCLWRPNLQQRKKYNIVLLLFDAIGLGVFSILAAYSAMEHNMPYIGIVFLGCISGCGEECFAIYLCAKFLLYLKKRSIWQH